MAPVHAAALFSGMLIYEVMVKHKLGLDRGYIFPYQNSLQMDLSLVQHVRHWQLPVPGGTVRPLRSCPALWYVFVLRSPRLHPHHPVPSPCLCFPPSPFSPSLVSILPAGRAVTHSRHLPCLTDNEDLTSKEVAFPSGAGVCTQLQTPFTIRSTESRCSGPTRHWCHP